MKGSRVREWLWRYGPAEALSFVATVGSAVATQRAGGNGVSIALAATWFGNLAYFGLILLQDIWRTRRKLRSRGRSYDAGVLLRNVRALVVEFGAAEALDSLLIRPSLMYWLPRWLHSVPWGIVAAKFLADITFYLPAIVSYELSKRSLRRF